MDPNFEPIFTPEYNESGPPIVMGFVIILFLLILMGIYFFVRPTTVNRPRNVVPNQNPRN